MTTIAARLLDWPGGRGVHLFERNVMSHRRMPAIILSGFFEPLFYLLSIRVGFGSLIGDVVDGDKVIEYAEFVAPALMAASAMNGAIFESTMNIFFKLKYEKLYDQMLATPLTTSDVARGEILWGQVRGAAYGAAFLLVMLAMGLVSSWWALLALPAAILIGFAFSAVCTSIWAWRRFVESE